MENKISPISFITHELKNPLAANKLYGEMLLKGVGGELTTKQKDMVQEMILSTDKMIELLNDFKVRFADL
jgi:signal transduction histidine kinase